MSTINYTLHKSGIQESVESEKPQGASFTGGHNSFSGSVYVLGGLTGSTHLVAING